MGFLVGSPDGMQVGTFVSYLSDVGVCLVTDTYSTRDHKHMAHGYISCAPEELLNLDPETGETDWSDAECEKSHTD